MIRLDGPLLARAWLAVATAASRDKNDPQVFKAMVIEEHPTGVRLIATDRLLTLSSWIPDLLHLYGAGSDEPDIATLPDRVVIAADLDDLAAKMLRHILVVAGRIEKGDYTIGDIEVSIDFDAHVPPAGPAGFEGMDPRHVVLRSPDVETVYVEIVETKPVDWRAAYDAHQPKPASDVMFNADLVERVGRVRRYAGDTVRLHLGGSTKPTRLEFPESDPDVSGVLTVKREKVDEVNP